MQSSASAAEFAGRASVALCLVTAITEILDPPHKLDYAAGR
jgi:hypothetical protein